LIPPKSVNTATLFRLFEHPNQFDTGTLAQAVAWVWPMAAIFGNTYLTLWWNGSKGRYFHLICEVHLSENKINEGGGLVVGSIHLLLIGWRQIWMPAWCWLSRRGRVWADQTRENFNFLSTGGEVTNIFFF